MSGVGLAAAAATGQDEHVTTLYAVRTTGIVCRVGCASRPPRPENIVWFDDLDRALASGFRPCRRCRPDAEHPQVSYRADVVRQALGYLRLGLSVEQTAARLHVSDRHLRRLVRQELGTSPRAAVSA
ncbi:MAG: Ada metal-binding domain-containing protein [Actinomycetota bacterium]